MAIFAATTEVKCIPFRKKSSERVSRGTVHSSPLIVGRIRPTNHSKMRLFPFLYLLKVSFVLPKFKAWTGLSTELLGRKNERTQNQFQPWSSGLYCQSTNIRKEPHHQHVTTRRSLLQKRRLTLALSNTMRWRRRASNLMPSFGALVVRCEFDTKKF